MEKKLYRLTDQANAELRRAAGTAGVVLMNDREAKFELRRGTIEPVAEHKPRELR